MNFQNPLLEKKSIEGTMRRTIEIDHKSLNEESRTVEVAITSEYPVKRWYGEEVLSHEAGAVRLERLQNGGSLLFNHDVNALVGVVENVRLDADKVLRGTVRFGTDEESNKRFMQVKEGILRSISAGYIIHSWKEEKTEDTYRYIATDWEPYEVSFVTVPADPTVGKDRSFKVESPTAPQEEDVSHNTVTDEAERKASTTTIEPSETRTAFVPDTPPILVEVKVEETEGKRTMTTKELLKEFTELADLAGIANARQLAQDEFIKETPLEDFRKILIEARAKENKTPVPSPTIGMSQRELSQYSLRKLLLSQIDSKVDASLELEASEAAKRDYNGEVKGHLIPFDVLNRALGATLNGATGATNLVPTELMSFIDLFRNALVLPSMGATMMTGLNGNVNIPRVTAGNSVTWLTTEGSQGNASDLTFDQVPLTPKTITARTQYTKQLLLQSSISVETLVIDQLAKVLALGFQQAIINGAGASGVPRGILNTSGIGSVAMGTNGGVITHDKLVELETSIATANTPLESLGYLTNSKVRGAMKTNRIDSGSGLFLLDQVSKEANGYPVYTTNAVPSNLTKGSSVGVCSAVIFGNWSELILGMWGGLDIMVNPYRLGQGTIEVEAMQMVDVAVKHPAAFSAILDVTTP